MGRGRACAGDGARGPEGWLEGLAWATPVVVKVEEEVGSATWPCLLA